MYRNYRCNMCNQNCNCCNKDNMMETLCSNVKNVVNDVDMCECGFDEENNVFPSNPVLGQSYVPWQTMNQTFTPEAGLQHGTIFPELVDPYVPCQSMEEIAFIAANNKIGKGCNKCQMN